MLLAEIENRKRRLQEKIRTDHEFAPEELCLIDGVYHVLYTVHSSAMRMGRMQRSWSKQVDSFSAPWRWWEAL
jgi:hypothetical protein